MSEIIKPGTRVTWTSQANAGYKTKVGTVLAFVPAWVDPIKALGRLREPHERADGLGASRYDRYLVAVPRGGRSKLVDIYTPYVSIVKEVL